MSLVAPDDYFWQSILWQMTTEQLGYNQWKHRVRCRLFFPNYSLSEIISPLCICLHFIVQMIFCNLFTKKYIYRDAKEQLWPSKIHLGNTQSVKICCWQSRCFSIFIEGQQNNTTLPHSTHYNNNLNKKHT